MVKLLFIFTLLLFPLGEITRILIGNNIAVTVNDVSIVTLIIFWIITYKKNRTKILSSKVFKGILGFAAICVLSLIFNANKYNVSELIVSFLYLIRWTMYAFLYFIVSEFDTKFKEKISYVMIFVGSLIVVGGYVQYFLYPNLRNLYYIGWDEHLYRMFSSFLDPNFVGAFFVLYLFFVVKIILNRSRQKNWKILSTLLLIASCTFVAVLLTYSRSTYVMFLIALCSAFFLKKRIKLFIGIFVVFIFLLFILSKISFQVEGTNLLRTTSIFSRIGEERNALTIIKDNPIIGVGFNAYRYAQYSYKFIDVDPIKQNHAGAGTDNSFLFVLATTGIIGLVAYIHMWYVIIRYVILGKMSEGLSSMRVVILSSLLGLFIHSLFINSLFYPFIMEWLWIQFGLIDYTSQ